MHNFKAQVLLSSLPPAYAAIDAVENIPVNAAAVMIAAIANILSILILLYYKPTGTREEH